ncbi:MAG: PilN domain-containing protein [Actinoplanes sp.]
MATPTTTALMPIDPALSAQHVSRIPPIRANLLPSEITSDRNARRTRLVLIGAVLVVLVLLGAWYAYALEQKKAADADLAAVAKQVKIVQGHKDTYNGLTSMIARQEAIAAQLADLLANDLPWATTLDTVRSTGVTSGVDISEMTGSVLDAEKATTVSGTVATLAISGSAPDKKTVANFLQALAKLKGITSPYLSTANEQEGGVQFTLTAMITTDALCGRYTTPCPTGGN